MTSKSHTRPIVTEELYTGPIARQQVPELMAVLNADKENERLLQERLMRDHHGY